MSLNAIGTGQRIGDVVKMKWEHFSDEGFDFTQGKTDKPLWIPLTDRLKAHLDGLARTDGTVVTDAKGRPVSYRIVAEEIHERHPLCRHITNRQIEDLIASKLVTPEQVRAAGLQA
ncbi:hypothetical protein [Roseovarius marisflavi]|nr:hypothetical protein [Roseovarius marisflavi]